MQAPGFSLHLLKEYPKNHFEAPLSQDNDFIQHFMLVENSTSEPAIISSHSKLSKPWSTKLISKLFICSFEPKEESMLQKVSTKLTSKLWQIYDYNVIGVFIS